MVPAEEPDGGGTPSEYGVPKLRQRIMQRLADAYADDNLELAEYERRVRRAEHAVTIAQLEALVADFPGAAGAPRHRPEAAVAAGSGAVMTIMGDRKLRVRTGRDLPSQVINLMGATRIDLRHAPPGAYELRVFNLMGATEVVVPYGTQVSRTLWAMFGDVSERSPKGKRTARAPFVSHQVTLAGASLFGEVTIREEREESSS